MIFHYDVVCPWAFLAAREIAAFELRTGERVLWRPVLLGGLFRHHAGDQDPTARWSGPRVEWGRVDLARAASLAGVPLRMRADHPRRSVSAMRLCLLAPEEVRPAVSLALFEAYWLEGRDISDVAVVADIARRFHLATEDIDGQKQALVEVTAEAAAAGAFGVPTFRIGDRLFWGGDRLPLIEAALGRPVRRPGDGEPAAPSGRVIEFYHDFASPFSYLASTRVEAVARRWGATVAWRPILLGALFREIGTADVPLLEMHAARRRWFAADMEAWAAFWGVPFQFPGRFPLRSVLALRVAIQQPAATAAIYRAAWAEGRDISEPAVLAGALAAAGFDADALIAGAGDPEVKASLRDNTDVARAIGSPGVPAFQVDDGPLFWGQDRLWQLERALSGWAPDTAPVA